MTTRRLCLLLFPLFWLLAFVAYYRAHGAQFVYDHNMWMIEYERLGWGGFKTQFGEKAVHYIFQYTYFVLYRLFKWEGWYWTLFQTAWHGMNAVLVFALIRRWCHWYALQKPVQIAFVAALFFVWSPYHTEAVIWGAGLEYMMVTTFILGGVIWLSSFFESAKTPHLILAYMFYLFALFTWELSLVFPLMAVTLYILSPYDGVSVRRFVIAVFLPMALLVPLYFLFAKWTSGSAIAHYGAATHMNLDPQLLVPNVTRFLMKLLDVSLIYSRAHSFDFIQWLSRPVIVALQLLVYIVIFIFCLRIVLLRKNQFWVLTAGVCLISLLPVLNLYYAYFTYIESDRYVYLCSGFFYGGLAAFIFSLHRYLKCILIGLFLFAQLFFLHRFVTAWQVSGRVVHGLVSEFCWQDASHIYVLATPDAVNGAWCLRSLPPHGIAIALKAQRGIDISGKMDEVMQYEMYSMHDSSHADRVGDSTFHYGFANYGNWFIKDGEGTHGWEDSLMKVRIDEWGMSYTVDLRKYKPGDVVIYQVGDHWQEVK